MPTGTNCMVCRYYNNCNGRCKEQKVYGVYNTVRKKFQFGIREHSKTKARKKLFDKIGNDARKWRFEIREIKGR